MILEKRIPIKYILSIAKGDLMKIVPFSIVLTTVTEIYDFTFHVPFSIPTLLGTAISLVLSFKLAQSYDRWWEARKVWGSIVNDSRSLVIQLKSFCGKNHELIPKISTRQIGWCYSLSQYLRNINDPKTIEVFLDRNDRLVLRNGKHKPLLLANLIGNDIKSLYDEKVINAYQQVRLFTTLGNLIDSMGQAERIKNTVFPKLYRLFLKMFIYIFILTLAIALGEMKYYYEVPLLIGLSMPFVLLEKTALLLQDPFENRPNDTSMTSICRLIEENINELLGESELPVPNDSIEDFYIL